MTTIRRARLSDVSRMIPLLEEYARQAEILPRNQDDLYRSIREWVVVEIDNKIVGMGSLLIMWQDLAEIRSLVIDPNYHGQRLGRHIVEMLLDDAEQMGLKRVFALTRKPGFFMKLGFKLTRIEQLPRKVKQDCVFCPKFHVCDEVALIISLTERANDRSVPVDEILRQSDPTPDIIPLQVAQASQ